jgi:hypothetical protein
MCALDTVLDGMVEIGFANLADQSRFEQASPLLFSDERNFIGHDVAYALPHGSRTLLDYDPDPVPNRAETGHRLHLHLHGAGDRFAAAMLGLAEAAAASPGIVKVRLHLPEPYSNSEPAPAAPEVDHRLPDVRRQVGILELGWSDRLAAERFVRSDAHAACAGALRGHLPRRLPGSWHLHLRQGRRADHRRPAREPGGGADRPAGGAQPDRAGSDAAVPGRLSRILPQGRAGSRENRPWRRTAGERTRSGRKRLQGNPSNV